MPDRAHDDGVDLQSDGDTNVGGDVIGRDKNVIHSTVSTTVNEGGPTARYAVIGITAIAALAIVVFGAQFIFDGSPDPTGAPVAPTTQIALPTATRSRTPTPSTTPTSTSGEPVETSQTSTPTATCTGTPTSTPTPTSTLNPGLGTFTTYFDEATDIVRLAFGPTIGQTSVCAFHNLRLASEDAGKQLQFVVRDLMVDASLLRDNAVSYALYRSLIGPWQSNQDVDMYGSPQAEDMHVASEPGGFLWMVTRDGDYVICIQTNVNNYYTSPERFERAWFTVTLGGR